MDDKNLHSNQMNHKNYPEPDIPADEAWASMKTLLTTAPGKVHPAKSGKPFSVKYFAYAGLGLIIMAVTAYYFWKDTPQKQPSAITYYSTDKPQKVTLSDGTLAFLNKNSSISELNNTAKERQTAVRGAAYFRERQFSNQPAHHLKLGTLDVVPVQANIYVSFDTVFAISAVYIQSGSAVIETGGQKLTLNAGESVKYDEKTGHISDKQAVDVNLFSYATRIFEFMDTSLKEAAESIENAYGVAIVFKNKNLYNCRITTRFDNKSLKEIFDLMAYTLNFTYQIDEKNNQVVLTGEGCE
mgnify:CR=1 FL=1